MQHYLPAKSTMGFAHSSQSPNLRFGSVWERYAGLVNCFRPNGKTLIWKMVSGLFPWQTSKVAGEKSRTTTCSYLCLRSTISANFGCSQETLNGAFPQSIMMVMLISRSSANRWETANHASKIASRFHVADMMTL